MSNSSFVIKKLHGFKNFNIGCSTGYLTSYYALKFPMSSLQSIDFLPKLVNQSKKNEDEIKHKQC